jgi:hypothetical protein
MEIILEIPSQKSTYDKTRLATVIRVYEDGGILLEARDNSKPAQFRLQPGDSFPWLFFLKKVCVAWHLSAMRALPFEFRPLRRIPQEIVDAIPDLGEKDAFKILDALRAQEYLPKLPKFGKKS